MSNTQTASELYERVGGAGSIDALVGAFYFNVLRDERVAHFFRDVSVNRVIHHQRLFLTEALGGGRGYAGRSLAAAHSRLIAEAGLKPEHFDAVIEILATTLTDLEVDEDAAQEVIDRVASLRGQIFTA
jgi:hemoglobin